MRTKLSIAAILLAALMVMLGCTKPSEKAPPPAPAGPVPVTVLFFNDLHGHLLPFTVKQDDGSKAEVGGIARMATIIRGVRDENAGKGVKTLVVIAGDILQGTPLSTVFHGKPDVEALNQIGIDAMVVGNHEFDFGLQNFLDLRTLAQFPIISGNIVYRDSNQPLCAPTATIKINDQLALSFVGVTTKELMYTTKPDNVARLSVTDPLAAAKQNYELVKAQGPVILLSHSKASTDEEIATAIPELAAIIGGHDQILLNPRKLVGAVPVFQAFEKGKYVGRIDLSIDPATKHATLTAWTYIPVTSAVADDPAIAALVNGYQSQLDAKFKEVIGSSAVFLDGERERVRYEETNLGDFVTDVMREYTSADVALLNAGSLRASIDDGPITLDAIFKTMPYENELMTVDLTGAELMAALTRGVSGARQDEDGGFLHVSGLKLKVRDKAPEDVTVGGQPLDLQKTYKVAITDFMSSGGDGYQMFVGKPALKTGLPLRELLVDTIRQRGRITTEKEGRIERVE